MKQEAETIVALEKRFWQSMVDKDAKLAKTMIADQCLVTGPNGVMKNDPDQYEAMTEEGKWTLETFKLSDVEGICPTDNTAVIAYKVHQTGEMGDKPMDLTCADSTTWVKQGGGWKCAIHTETVIEGA